MKRTRRSKQKKRRGTKADWCARVVKRLDNARIRMEKADDEHFDDVIGEFAPIVAAEWEVFPWLVAPVVGNHYRRMDIHQVVAMWQQLEPCVAPPCSGEGAHLQDVCLIYALRALGFKVPFTVNGPFWALAQGNAFLQPHGKKLQTVRLGNASQLRPGSNVLGKDAHFNALQVRAHSLELYDCRSNSRDRMDVLLLFIC